MLHVPLQFAELHLEGTSQVCMESGRGFLAPQPQTLDSCCQELQHRDVWPSHTKPAQPPHLPKIKPRILGGRHMTQGLHPHSSPPQAAVDCHQLVGGLAWAGDIGHSSSLLGGMWEHSKLLASASVSRLQALPVPHPQLKDECLFSLLPL